ncbi:MAG TPA: cupredoxin domain-containing protein [Candidatus Eremiobacteraceae bacterium]|nr:cupredoxin domain-containing protein [Candidatus Eremiobacteraceae bacterium]
MTKSVAFGAVLGGVFVAAALALASSAPASAHPTIDLAVSNWKFVPAKITIPADEPTTLRLTATQGVHGIQSAELGIPQTTIPNGKTVLVTFTPTKPGTYIVHCSVFCGPGHADMALTVVVTGP